MLEWVVMIVVVEVVLGRRERVGYVRMASSDQFTLALIKKKKPFMCVRWEVRKLMPCLALNG